MTILSNYPYAVREVASILGVSVRTVLVWINQGYFPNAYKLNPSKKNSPYYIPRAEVQAFQSRQQKSG
jgi:predicted DNA-binding transcriptional regulator AlpA